MNGPSQRDNLDSQLLPSWFAVYTASRHEKRVAQYLVECVMQIAD